MRALVGLPMGGAEVSCHLPSRGPTSQADTRAEAPPTRCTPPLPERIFSTYVKQFLPNFNTGRTVCHNNMEHQLGRTELENLAPMREYLFGKIGLNFVRKTLLPPLKNAPTGMPMVNGEKVEIATLSSVTRDVHAAELVEEASLGPEPARGHGIHDGVDQGEDAVCVEVEPRDQNANKYPAEAADNRRWMMT